MMYAFKEIPVAAPMLLLILISLVLRQGISMV